MGDDDGHYAGPYVPQHPTAPQLRAARHRRGGPRRPRSSTSARSADTRSRRRPTPRRSTAPSRRSPPRRRGCSTRSRPTPRRRTARSRPRSAGRARRTATRAPGRPWPSSATTRTASSTSSSTSGRATRTGRRRASRSARRSAWRSRVAEYRNGNDKLELGPQDHGAHQVLRRHAQARRDRLAEPLPVARARSATATRAPCARSGSMLQNEDRTEIVMTWTLLRARPVKHVVRAVQRQGHGRRDGGAHARLRAPRDRVSDPFSALHFRVEIRLPGAAEPLCEAAFAECDGMEMSFDVKSLLEGGDAGSRRLLAGPASFGEVTLRRGMTESFDLWDWCGDRSVRADARVVMLGGGRRGARALPAGALPARAAEGAAARCPVRRCRDRGADAGVRVADARARRPRAGAAAAAEGGAARARREAAQGGRQGPLGAASSSTRRDLRLVARRRRRAARRSSCGSRAEDVRELTRRVAHFAPPGPPVRFAWGTFRFDGCVEALEETLDVFAPDGRAAARPARAVAARCASRLSARAQSLSLMARLGTPHPRAARGRRVRGARAALACV